MSAILSMPLIHISAKTIEEFSALFQGNPGAHYTFTPGEYGAIDRGITHQDTERHLRGELPALLSIPIMPDGLCHFGAIDVDRHNDSDVAVDHVELACRITELGLPLIVAQSKRPKGAHLYLFLKDRNGFSASVVQQLVEKYMGILQIGAPIELFPKQEALKRDEKTGELQKGSGLNLPYFGSERVAFGRDGEELDLAGFVDLARKRQSFGKILQDRDLADNPAVDAPEEKTDKPLPIDAIRKIHDKNLQALRESNNVGRWNDTLNTTAFFAARAFAAKALEGTEKEVKTAIREAAAALDGWNERKMESTLNSGWESGIKQPLKVLEDLFPERTATLNEFNAQYYVVTNLGGKVRVCWDEIDQNTGTLSLVIQSFDDFRNAHMHERILTGEKETSTGRGKNKITVSGPEYQTKGNFWLECKQRQQFDKIVYAPGEKLGPTIRNLWRGFAVEPVKGDCGLYLKHVFENICKSDKAKYDWLISWFAWKVRNPGLKSYTAPVLRGCEGIGKNKCADPFMFLWGPHGLQVTKKEHVVGHFNAHLRACSVLVANEALFAGDRSHESTLKSLITDELFVIEAKGVDAVKARNRISLIVVSNENWVVPAGPTARRFSVFDCGKDHLRDFPYFRAVQNQLDGVDGSKAGYKALLHHLLFEVDLTGFEVHDIIRTSALSEQQAESVRGADALWLECLSRGELPGGLNGNFLQSERLLAWAQRQRNRKFEGITDVQLSQVFGANTIGVYEGMNFPHAKPQPKVKGVRVRAWAIPSLRDARAAWDKKRFPVAWQDVQPLQLAEPGEMVFDTDDWRLVRVGDEPQEKGDGLPDES